MKTHRKPEVAENKGNGESFQVGKVVNSNLKSGGLTDSQGNLRG